MENFPNFDTYIEDLEKKDIDYEELFNQVNSSVLTDKLPKSSTISRKQALNNINKAYQNDKLVLVLGAGISLEFGVPTWNELLQNLMVYSIEKEHKVSSVLSKFYNEIFRPNPLIAGRYLQGYFAKDNSSFESMVRDVLYSNVDKNVNSRLLDEIVRLCVKPDIHHNLDSIISYNFDDILECRLEKADVNIPYKPIFGLGMETKNGELPIYHVHGYLPEKRKLDLANKIIFGENNYHQQYSDIYSWNNIVQINKFRENTCLLIGSSLTDPNIRRLLDIALKQKGNRRKHHYIFKEKIKTSALKAKLNIALTSEIQRDNNYGLNFDETIELLKGIYERFEENDSASFGVQTIWIDDWKEVPIILKKMRENVA